VGIVMWLPMVILSIACIAFGVFAYRLPLHTMILPAMKSTVSFTGIWWSGPATIMLIASFVVGGVIYLVTTTRKARVCETYIGGEKLADVYVSGEAHHGAQRDIEVTGTDFYKTIQEIPLFARAYKLAGEKVFDVYDVGSAVVFYFFGLVRKAHNGALPIYLTWFLAGMLVIIALLIGY
jgi:NADH:ubiquinone oxidoreductase subunit 5 (subunit L)/multisubunit Na+/H+ antiporter MnhA subunit